MDNDSSSTSGSGYNVTSTSSTSSSSGSSGSGYNVASTSSTSSSSGSSGSGYNVTSTSSTSSSSGSSGFGYNVASSSTASADNSLVNTYAASQLSSTSYEGRVDLPSFSFSYNFYKIDEGRYGIQLKGELEIDEISGASLLNFSDQALTLSEDIAASFDQLTGINDTPGVVFRLYNAAFARLPDAAGLKNWIGANESGARTYKESAEEFASSKEFSIRYGSNVSDSDYVHTLYRNVLGRDPDIGGLNHYLDLLGSGKSRGALLLDFSESPENRDLFTKATGLS